MKMHIRIFFFFIRINIFKPINFLMKGINNAYVRLQEILRKTYMNYEG